MATAQEQPIPIPTEHFASQAPPPGLRISHRPELGNVLEATQAFASGAVVIEEQPLLLVPELRPSHPIFKPLQAYFEKHLIPASVVLKLAAFYSAPPDVQQRVLGGFYCPDPEAFADSAVVKQGHVFARTLQEDPPLPQFRQWVSEQGVATLLRVWLIWCCNGHRHGFGSALFEYGSKLTHTCGQPNTAYSSKRAAAGGAQAGRGAVPAGGMHVAMADIAAGDIITTSYLGWSLKALMSTPARQRRLADKYLFRCSCTRCTQEVDRARGVPCPTCSAGSRGEDRLLTEAAALDVNGACGFIYCDMAKVTDGGDGRPWVCDKCQAAFPNDLKEVWGRWYTRSYDHIEADMESFVLRLDESMEESPLFRDAAAFTKKTLDIARLLGPRHWVTWRMVMLGIEVQCSEVDRLSDRAARLKTDGGSSAAVAGAVTNAVRCADAALRYSDVLWTAVDEYTDADAGEMLAEHMSECASVLVQFAAGGVLIDAPDDAHRLLSAATQLRHKVQPALERAARIAGKPVVPGGGAAVPDGEMQAVLRSLAALKAMPEAPAPGG